MRKISIFPRNCSQGSCSYFDLPPIEKKNSCKRTTHPNTYVNGASFARVQIIWKSSARSIEFSRIVLFLFHGKIFQIDFKPSKVCPRVTILILCPECVEIVVLSNIKVKDIFHLKSTEFIQITNLIKSSADLRHDLLLVSKLNPKIYIYLWKILHNFSRSVFTLCVKHLQRSMKSIKSGTS